MKKSIGIGLSALLILVMGAAAALASHAATLDFKVSGTSVTSVASGTVVDVVATADATLNRTNAELHVDICAAVDTSGSTPVTAYASSADCANSAHPATWQENWATKVGVPYLGGQKTITKAFDTATTEVPAVGFRVRYKPQDGADGHAESLIEKDLNINYGSSSNACNAVTAALEKIQAKGNGNGKAAVALEKVIEDRLNC